MDFFAQQDSARRKTGWLVLYFSLGLIGLIVAIYGVLAVLLAQMNVPMGSSLAPGTIPWLRWDLLAEVALGTSIVVAAGSLYKTMQLSKGGETVAVMLGGRPINADTRDLDERRLLNVVEEMSIASGVPVPPVYLLDQEKGINAFAAGHEPTNAVIGVTRGTVELLNRDQLQGVMAHEFSHILNGDMKLNIRLTGLIHGILVLSIIGYYILRFGGSSSRSSSNNKGGAAPLVLFGLSLYLLGLIGMFFGQVIQAAVSRQREYLADASAVQFTRNPEGIAGALKAIAAWANGSKLKDAHAPEFSHLFFSTGAQQLFATHPPLTDRIKRIDPHWDGVLPDLSKPKPKEPVMPVKKPARGAIPLPVGNEILGQAGIPGIGNVAVAAAILEGLSEPLTQAIHEPFSAQAVVYVVLLHADADIRQRQLNRLARELKPSIYQAVEKLIPEMSRLPEGSQLPTIELVLPTLRQLSVEQYQHFRENVENLVNADRRITIFEFVLQLFVIRCLDEHFGLRARRRARVSNWQTLKRPFVAVLGLLAHLGSDEPQVAKASFDAGLKSAGLAPGAGSLPAREEASLHEFGKALEELSEAVPPIKRQILAGCLACALADRQVTVNEYEVLRAIASVLEIPMPPLALGQQAY